MLFRSLNPEDFHDLNYETAVLLFVDKCNDLLNEKREQFPENLFKEFLKVIFLRVIDTYWMDHIDAMSELRQAVSLQAYAQVNPLREYKEIGFQTFEEMIGGIENDTIKFLNRAQIRGNLEREQVIKPVAATSGNEDTSRKKVPATSQKVGRNDPCPCGSGKKYKNCHGK